MSSTSTTINQLNAATTTIVMVLTIVCFALGAVSLIFNVIIFTRRSLCREPCSVYFFWSSSFNLFIVYVLVPIRVLAFGYNIDISSYNNGVCKIINFVNYSSRAITCWLIVLACVDRFCHSSTNATIRRMSSLKKARWGVGIVILSIMILYSHMLVYYGLSYTLNQFGNTVATCNSQIGTYRTFIAFWFMALYSLCPSFFMLLFGLLTLKNIRQHRQVVPTVAGTNQLVRRTDNQLLRMLIAQVLMVFISTLPYSIYLLYTGFTSNIQKDTLRITQENFAGRVTGSFINFAHTTSFYLYTLTGTVFRKEFHRIILRCRHPTRDIVSTT
ncbi:unnamed protein product [Adineta steineri]|uniref:G-protein coupled receptors family 1 profile domain-containing protein n=1 Tax=Adineta steineri TaxID=433720 RepID=A0A813ZH95_9BILA|nr:unnamed protein product [Adineta steineri]CAF1428514.1 unnamed protein product [Adineta steineri]